MVPVSERKESEVAKPTATGDRRNRLRLAAVVALLAVGVAAALAGSAFADQVANNLDTTVDSTPEAMALTVGGANGSVGYFLNADASGKPGCDLTGPAKQLNVDLHSSDASVATLDSSSVQLTACGTSTSNVAAVSVHPVGAGSATITATFHNVITQSGATSSGDYEMDTATFTVNVSNPTPANSPPSAPGVPRVAAGTSPRADGDFTLSWDGSTDPDAGDAVSYTLEQHDASSSTWAPVASGLSSASYTFGGSNPAEAEGTWSYRVEAVDTHGATSAFAESDDLVKVDESAPNAPTATETPTAAYVDPSGSSWYEDSVTVGFTGNGDPSLADGSDGTGVASVTGAQTFDSTNVDPVTGAFSVTGQATDEVGNESGTPVNGYVDWQTPTVSVTPTPAAVYTDGSGNRWWKDSVSLDVAAGDPAPSSGLAVDPSTSLGPLTGVGSIATGTYTATDNVGHSGSNSEFDYNVDSQAPTVSVTPTTDAAYIDGLGNGWWKDSVSFTVAAGDPAPSSGLATDPSGTLGPYTTSGAVPVQTAADNVGHSTSFGPVGYDVDSQAPTFGDCSGETFLLNSGTHNVSITAQDEVGGSGLDVGSSLLSGTVDTSAPGDHQVTFTAYDNVGHESQTTCDYEVDYNLGKGFLPPLNADIHGTVLNVGKAGKTYPVKWQLTDANGAYVTTAVSGTTVDVAKVACTNLAGDPLDSMDYNTSSGGTTLRYDSTANQYVYNWQTPGTQGCYRLTVTLVGSGQKMVAAFQLK